MTESSRYKIYIDTSDRNETKIVLYAVDKTGEKVLSEKKGKLDVVPAISDMLNEKNISLKQLEIISANQGPGSFTGLRIGLTVANVLNWVLGKRTSENIDAPVYGSEPNITPPKKFKL